MSCSPPLEDVEDLADAEPHTMLFRLPTRLTRPARHWLRIEATRPWADAFTT